MLGRFGAALLGGGGELASGSHGGSIALTTGPVTLSNVMDRALGLRQSLCSGRVLANAAPRFSLRLDYSNYF